VRILIAPDKFKGSLTASQVCDAIGEGIIKKFPNAEILKFPFADGGEGTVDILTKSSNGKKIRVKVHGPLFDEIEAEYGIDRTGTVAFVEMSAASGLELIPKEKRDPLETTTLGTGELIAHAVEHGATKIILGIGGSSTNDAGIGMATALGYKFFSGDELLRPIGKNLARVDRIEVPGTKLNVTALCDVNNPLFGPNGAARIYGPQKGATPEGVEQLDLGLQNFERVARKTFGRSVDFPGAGAGGGIAGGASVFFNLEVTPGVTFIMNSYGLREKIRSADLVITGEGKIDRQTLAGKVVGTIAREASTTGKKVIAVCGICELRKNEMEKIGISDVVSLVDPFVSPEEAREKARELIIAKLSSREFQ
jgi:glycerate kinase